MVKTCLSVVKTLWSRLGGQDLPLGGQDLVVKTLWSRLGGQDLVVKTCLSVVTPACVGTSPWCRGEHSL